MLVIQQFDNFDNRAEHTVANQNNKSNLIEKEFLLRSDNLKWMKMSQYIFFPFMIHEEHRLSE